MRQEYTLTDDELNEIKRACAPVPYMVIGGMPPRSQQQNANDAWEALGRKRGFKWDTVRPVDGKSENVISAVASPQEKT